MPSDFFSNLISRIFPERNEGDHAQPFVTEILDRSIRYRHSFAAWSRSARQIAMMDELLQQQQLAHSNGHSNQAFQLYQSPQSNGFYFNAATGFSTEEFRFVLDLFQERTEALGYRKQLAERRYSVKPNGVHCLERCYLKPELSSGIEPPIDQIFGNVHLELVLLNDEASYLKVMAHVYNDRNYLKARPFADFAERLMMPGQDD